MLFCITWEGVRLLFRGSSIDNSNVGRDHNNSGRKAITPCIPILCQEKRVFRGTCNELDIVNPIIKVQRKLQNYEPIRICNVPSGRQCELDCTNPGMTTRCIIHPS